MNNTNEFVNEITRTPKYADNADFNSCGRARRKFRLSLLTPKLTRASAIMTFTNAAKNTVGEARKYFRACVKMKPFLLKPSTYRRY